MKFTFWQNVLSIHQSAFICALSQGHEVSLVVERKLETNRIAEGWMVPNMGRAIVIVAPSDDEIIYLMQDLETEHIFSGIDAFPMVYRAFRYAIRLNRKVSVMAEPYEWIGIKGLLRRIKYIGLNMRYGGKIKHFFATGQTGIDCYLKAGFPMYKLHHWGYFVKYDDLGSHGMSSLIKNKDCSVNKLGCRVLFVGRLDDNKNIMSILKNYNQLDDVISEFTIIGDGPLRDKVIAESQKYKNIKVLGSVPNTSIAGYMREHDYLILPSKYDGWGAVINEALLQGTRVICSSSCGASILIDGCKRGISVDNRYMIETIRHWCKKGTISMEHRFYIRKWAIDNISGSVVSKYFVDIMSNRTTDAPWIKNRAL